MAVNRGRHGFLCNNYSISTKAVARRLMTSHYSYPRSNKKKNKCVSGFGSEDFRQGRHTYFFFLEKIQFYAF